MKLRTRLVVSVLGVATVTYGTLVVIASIDRRRFSGEMLHATVHERLAGEQERCEAGGSPWDGSLVDVGPPGAWRRARFNVRPPELRPMPPGPKGMNPDGGPPPPGYGPQHGDSRPPPPPRGDGLPPGAPRQEPMLAVNPGPPQGRVASFFVYDAELHSKVKDAPVLDPALLSGMASAEAVTLSTGVFAHDIRILIRTPWGTGPCSYVLADAQVTHWGMTAYTLIWSLPTLIVVITLLIALGPTVARLRRLTSAVREGTASEVVKSETQGDEISELSQAFHEAGQRIQTQMDELIRREKALRDFVANTTHDVMIPLTVLQGHLTRLRDDGQAAPALGAAMNEAHYVGSLLHNLGIAARLDSAEPRMQRSPVDLGALLQRVLARHRPIAEERGVAIDAAMPLEPLIVDADAMLVEQAVSNVTYNAVRYNNSGGHVAIVAERKGESGFVIRVLDDGPGIPDDKLSTIFERGVRGDDARNRNAGGQGLGLDIARRALELQGFAITLQNCEGGGLEASITGSMRTA